MSSGRDWYSSNLLDEFGLSGCIIIPALLPYIEKLNIAFVSINPGPPFLLLNFIMFTCIKVMRKRCTSDPNLRQSWFGQYQLGLCRDFQQRGPMSMVFSINKKVECILIQLCESVVLVGVRLALWGHPSSLASGLCNPILSTKPGLPELHDLALCWTLTSCLNGYNIRDPAYYTHLL